VLHVYKAIPVMQEMKKYKGRFISSL